MLAARVVAGLAAVFWGWLFFGVQDTLTVFVEGHAFAAHYLMESGWGLLFLVLVAFPLIGLTFRPSTGALVAEVAAVGMAVIVGALMSRSAAHLLPGAGLVVTALAIAALGRADTSLGRLRPDPPLVLLALVATVPALGYAWRMARATSDVEKTIGLDHYPIQAALGIALVLVAYLIAIARDRSGVQLATATLVITVGWMGIESAVYPHRLGSFGTTWGWLALAWAVAWLIASLPRRMSRQERVAVGPGVPDG